MVFYTTFNSISVISRQQLTLLMSFLGFTSTRLGSEVSYPRTLPRKNLEDPVRLKPRTPGLQNKHFTTGPRGALFHFSLKFSLRTELTLSQTHLYLHVNSTCLLKTVERAISLTMCFLPCRRTFHDFHQI